MNQALSFSRSTDEAPDPREAALGSGNLEHGVGQHEPSRADESGTIVPLKRAATRMKRLNINLPIGVFDDLEELATTTGRTMTDIVRTALGLIALAISEERNGRKLVIAEPNGKAVKEIILPK